MKRVANFLEKTSGVTEKEFEKFIDELDMPYGVKIEPYLFGQVPAEQIKYKNKVIATLRLLANNTINISYNPDVFSRADIKKVEIKSPTIKEVESFVQDLKNIFDSRKGKNE